MDNKSLKVKVGGVARISWSLHLPI